MRFTTARPELSCHPERLLAGARSVVSAALCYYEREPERPPGHGRLPRYAWHDGYAELRAKLDRIGRSLGAPYRVLVDANEHVDREAAARSGVGFYGKNTMLITRRHGSWVVLGTLVTAAELEPTPPLDADCGSCRLCVDACPTGALDAPGTLDATRCLSYWTQTAEPIPVAYREPLGAQVYGCDICQEACPWNRGVERRRAGRAADAAGHVDLVRWLAGDADALDRLFVPRNDVRWLQRNALVAAGNVGDARTRGPVERHAAGDDPMLAEHARWALARLEERT
jgi:epoxyqueuosine reductase